MAARKYRLYAARVTGETVALAEKERFVRITAGYMLLYRTTAPKKMQTVEIKGADLKRLTERDRLWLADCIAAALADGVKKNRADTQKRLNELLDAWERELEKERSRIDKEAAHGAGEAQESDK